MLDNIQNTAQQDDNDAWLARFDRLKPQFTDGQGHVVTTKTPIRATSGAPGFVVVPPQA